MNRKVMDYLERKMRGDRDYRSGDRRRGSLRYDYETDGRRGVKGTGRYGRDYEDNRDYAGRRGSNDYRGGEDYRGEDYDYDYERGRDYAREYEDYNSQGEMKLTKADINHWKNKMHNVDGSHGEHYDLQQILPVAERAGVRFNSYDEKEFCLVVNMMYSDYCQVIKKHVPVEKELMLYVELAKAFLDDPDGPEPSEKLALYYHCIVSSAEE